MALEIRDLSGGTALHVRVSDKLTKAEYEKFVPEVERRIKEHGRIRILLEMHDFHGWEMSAVWEDLKFDWKHYKDIARLAMVGDKAWEKWMAGFCQPFTTAEIRYFDAGRLDEARAWLLEP